MAETMQILIMGRANVGKSTFVNRLLGKNQAITYDMPGVTRDISRYACSWKGIPFELIDSGGIVLKKDRGEQKDVNDPFYMQGDIDSRVLKVIDSATHIVFLTNGRDGVHPLDEHIAKVLRSYAHKVHVLVNKVDDLQNESSAAPFYRIGLGEPTPVSALNGGGIKSFMDQLMADIRPSEKTVSGDDNEYKITIVGRPNVGKSSLVNAVINDDLLLVDNQAGTTRDAVSLYFERDNQRYMFTDTAGMRKKAKVDDGVEYYSVLRSKQSIEHADLVIFMTDLDEFMCEQDRKIIDEVLTAKKNMIIFINKWDTTGRTDEERRKLLKIAKHAFPALEYYPIITGSAKEKLNLNKLFTTIPDVIQQGLVRIPTAELNIFFEQVIRHNPPPAKKGQRVKIYYATQVGVHPPIFVCFINKPKIIDPNYCRYVEKRLRDAFGGFKGNTLELKFKPKESHRGALAKAKES